MWNTPCPATGPIEKCPATGLTETGPAAGPIQNEIPGLSPAEGPLCRALARALAALPHDGPVAEDAASRALLDLASRAAASDATILVTGPTGAGKDVMARFLHSRSPRSGAAFLAVNCAALPDQMLEALLFGHERGAFTGALAAAPGLFRAAGHGTLFLDELGELPLPLQAKLLRAVEQREVLPLGATAPVPVHARLVAATNRDLAAAVAAGTFREDLYWRLSVFPIALRPLAERRADILPLIAHLLRARTARARLSEQMLGRLVAHDWPGNVRELGNLIERALILAGDGPVTDAHVQLPARQAALPALPDQLRRQEADALGRALAEAGGRRGEAARRLGISERTLRYKLAAQAGRPRTTAREVDRHGARKVTTGLLQ
jgi:two-component system response regulator FlrC